MIVQMKIQYNQNDLIILQVFLYPVGVMQTLVSQPLLPVPKPYTTTQHTRRPIDVGGVSRFIAKMKGTN